MTKDDAIRFFSTLFRGEHHIPGEVKPYGHGWAVTMGGSLSTYDDNALTRLVFLAHESCVRAQVSTAGMRLRIAIHPRQREGSIMTAHPTIDAALARWNASRVDPAARPG